MILDRMCHVLKPILAVAATLTLAGLSQAFAADFIAEQPRTSYEAAIQNKSTSPSYVAITVIDGRSGMVRPVCTTANLLLGAIHLEYGLDYGALGSSKADEIALKSQDHVFRFEKQAALDNIPSTYSQHDLSAARALLASFSIEELKKLFGPFGSGLPLESGKYPRNAVACALLERGLSPILTDRSGQLRVAR